MFFHLLFYKTTGNSSNAESSRELFFRYSHRKIQVMQPVENQFNAVKVQYLGRTATANSISTGSFSAFVFRIPQNSTTKQPRIRLVVDLPVQLFFQYFDRKTTSNTTGEKPFQYLDSRTSACKTAESTE